MQRTPSLVSAAARLALEAAPYVVLLLYFAAEALVAVVAIGRPEILVVALPIAAAGAVALESRRRRARRPGLR